MSVDEMVNVSVANLFTQLESPGSDPVAFAVRHPTGPSKPWQALSAGPKFSGDCRRILKWLFSADPEGFVHDDARCRIQLYQVRAFSKWLQDDSLNTSISRAVSWEPWSELTARLSRPYWEQVDPPLTNRDLREVSMKPLGLVRQPPPQNENERGGRGAKVRFFMLWAMQFSNKQTLAKFIKSPVVQTLTPDDLATTQGGRCIGHATDRYGQVIKLANNIGVVDYRSA